MEPLPAAPAFWTRHTRWLQWRVNFAWWLERFLPALFIAAVCVMALVLAGRRAQWPPLHLAWATGACVAAAAAFALVKARHRFIGQAEARAMLDYSLGTHTRLSAASAGIGTWPDREAWHAGSWTWDWRRLALLPSVAAGLVLAAWWVPVTPARATLPPPTAKPPALSQAEEWIAALDQNPAVEEQSLEPVREQAAQLAREKPEEWYTHAGLEAADHLRAKLAGGMQTFAQGAAEMDNLLGAMSAPGAELSEMQATAFQEQLAAAIAGLEGNMPGLNRDLARRLRDIDPSRLRNISPETVKRLRDQLKQGIGQCKNCLGSGEDLPGAGDGEEGGRGGVNRGRGDAPLTFEKTPTDLKTTQMDTLENDNTNFTALGDRVGMSAGDHEVDRGTAHRAASGGGVAAGGNGAGTVWLPSHLPPAERQRLREFFK